MNMTVDVGVGMSSCSLLRDKAPLLKGVIVTGPKADLPYGHMGCGMTFSPKMNLLQSLHNHDILLNRSNFQTRGLRSALAHNHFTGKPQQRNKAIFRGARRGR